MYRLAVSIPTYNRRDLLAPLLDVLLEQAAGADVQIVVTDNASDDGTEELCRDYARRHRRLKYVRYDRNWGPDHNFLASVAHADAEYCWLFGSDDMPRPKAMARVLNLLQTSEPDILLFDRLWCDYWMRPTRVDRFLTVDAECTFDTNCADDVRRYLAASCGLCALLSFLSSVVVRKSRWDAAPTPEMYMRSAYVHTAKLLGVFAAGCKLVYAPEPLVLCRGDNEGLMEHGLFNRARLDFVWYSRMIRRFFPREPEMSLALRVVRREFTPLRLALLAATARGLEAFELVRHLRTFRYPTPVQLAFGLLAALPPLRWLLSLAVKPARNLWWRRQKAATNRALSSP